MSAVILCEAVKEQIKSVLTPSNPQWIDVRGTGQPTSAVVGDLFVAIHSGGWKYNKLNNGIDEEYWVNATVSIKLSMNHKAFWGVDLNLPWEGSLSYAVRAIVNAIHLQPDVINMANARLQTGISSPFVEMLQASGNIDEPEERGPEWWSGVSTSKSTRVSQVIGYSQTVRFFGGRRIQGIGNYT